MTTAVAASAAGDLERGRIAVVAGSVLAILAIVPVLIALSLTDWPYAFVIAGGGSAALLLSALLRRDRLLLHIWWFALVFGVAELAVDAWLVSASRTLDYAPYSSRGGPMVWASPVFMPLAWQVLVAHVTALTQLASGWRLDRRMLLALAIGAAYIPIGEELSIRAGFWIYGGVPMIGHVPYYILMGETLLAVAVVLLIPMLEHQRWIQSASAGILACLVLASGYAFGIALF